MKNTFQPSPGIAVVKEFKQENTSSVMTKNSSKGRIITGTIVYMGLADMTTSGVLIKPELFGKVGNTIWFLHYYDEGGVDVGEIDGVEYFFVKFQDIRGRL